MDSIFLKIDLSKLSQKEWDILSEADKISILQAIEKNISKIQNRHERRIFFKHLDNGEKGKYIFNEPKSITIYDISNLVTSIETVIHEGTHALVDDAKNGVVNSINLTSKIDAKSLQNIVSGRDIIYKHFSNTNNITRFKLLYYEEQLARYESYIHLIKGIIGIPNKYFQIKNEMLRNVIKNAANYYINCKKVEQQFGEYHKEEETIEFKQYREELLPVKNFDIILLDNRGIELDLEIIINNVLRDNGINMSIEYKPHFSFETVSRIEDSRRLFDDDYKDLG